MYQAICSAYKNLEILQHDMKNDLLSLQTLIHQGKNGEAEISNGNYENIQYEMLLNYLKNIGKHNFQIIGGYSFQEEISSGSYDDIRRKDLKLLTTANIVLQSNNRAILDFR